MAKGEDAMRQVRAERARQAKAARRRKRAVAGITAGMLRQAAAKTQKESRDS